MVEWLAGNRIRGTSTERTSTTGFNPVAGVVGGWKEVGRTTLGGTGALDVSSLADKRYLMYLLHKPSGGSAIDMRLNSDTGTNYSRRYSNNGTDNSNVSQTGLFGGNLYFGDYNEFMVSYVSNVSTKEKLGIAHLVGGNTAGTAPSRLEIVSKWDNTSTAIDRLTTSGSGLPTGSELVVLGWDPEDTHTTNFWEELASVTTGSTGTSIDSGTFTAKKYLWVQMYAPSGQSAIVDNHMWNFNGDSGSNYAVRLSNNGGGEITDASQSSLSVSRFGTEGDFSNSFIINNSANEKLMISHAISVGNTLGAGAAPNRNETVGKWANTSSQITSIIINTNADTIPAGWTIKVWGSD